MSNKRKLRRQRAPKRRCKCGSTSFRIKPYPDAILYICRNCRFPVREVRK